MFARAVDASGNASVCKSLVIYTQSSGIPMVTSVSSTAANGSYPAGSTIPITITFSEIVTVNGTPQLTLATGGGNLNKVINYSSGSGTTTLTFNYTVGLGESSTDLDYAATTALSLNGGTIRDADGNAANLTLPPVGGYSSIAGQKDIVILTTPPTLTYISSAPYSPGSSRTPAITLLSSETATVTLYSDSGCSSTISAPVGFTKNTPAAISTYSLPVNAATSIYGRAVDVVANISMCTALVTYTHDNVGPVVSSFVRDAGQPGMTNSLPINFVVTFNEAINPATFTASDIANNGTAVAVNWLVTQVSSNVFTVTATTAGAGTIIPRLAAGSVTDVAGNSNVAATNASQSVSYSEAPFTVTVNQAVGQADPTNSLPVNFTVVFSSAVGYSTLTHADIIQNGTASGITWSLSTLDNITWNLGATSVVTPGTIMPSLAANTVMDAFGNQNATSVSTDNFVVYDTTAPMLSFSGIIPSSPSSSLTPTLYGTTSKPSTVILYYDSSCSTPRSSSVSNIVFASPGMTVTSNVAANTTTTIYGRAVDTAGNQSPCTNLVTYTHDAISPTVLNVNSSLASGAYKSGQVVPIHITFSEVVTVTGTPQITLETGNQDAVVNYTSGSGTNTLTFNYSVWDGDNSPDLDYRSTTSLALNGGTIRDSAGNNATLTLPAVGGPLSLSGNKSIVIDTTTPSITFTSISPASPGTSQTPQVTVSVSEALTSLRLYSDSLCLLSISANASAASGSNTVTTTTLAANATTAIYARANDLAGNTSSCIYMTAYTHAN